MQFLLFVHRWHTWAVTHTTDLCPRQHPLVSFRTLWYFIPSRWVSVHSARMHLTTSKKRAGCSLSLTILGASNGTIVMDSASSWFIDLCPRLSCECSKSCHFLSKITFSQSISSPKLQMGFVLHHRWLWGNNWLNICGGLHHNERTCEVLLCWMWPSEAVKDFTHPSLRLRPENSGGEEEEGRSRGRLTDGLSEWIIDRGLLADAASINSSKPLWCITADKQCWASKCVFNKARWWCCCFPPELQTSGYKLCPRTFSFSTQEGAPLHCSKTHLFTLKVLSLTFFIEFLILRLLQFSCFNELFSTASKGRQLFTLLQIFDEFLISTFF